MPMYQMIYTFTHLIILVMALVFQGNIYRKVTFPGSKTRISPAIFPSGGDVLYIPRGFVHEASTENIASLHVTLAIPTFVSWLEPG